MYLLVIWNSNSIKFLLAKFGSSTILHRTWEFDRHRRLTGQLAWKPTVRALACLERQLGVRVRWWGLASEALKRNDSGSGFWGAGSGKRSETEDCASVKWRNQLHCDGYVLRTGPSVAHHLAVGPDVGGFSRSTKGILVKTIGLSKWANSEHNKKSIFEGDIDFKNHVLMTSGHSNLLKIK